MGHYKNLQACAVFNAIMGLLVFAHATPWGKLEVVDPADTATDRLISTDGTATKKGRQPNPKPEMLLSWSVVPLSCYLKHIRDVCFMGFLQYQNHQKTDGSSMRDCL